VAGRTSRRVGRASRIALSLFGTIAGVLVLGGASFAAGILSITPDAGPPGTEFEVRVACDEAPRAYENERSGPHMTLPQPVFTEETPGSWVYRRTAFDHDVVYTVDCGDRRAEGRFDTDKPRLFPGPVADHGFGVEPTRVDGTDCPAGTRAEVDIQVGSGPDGTVSHTVVDIDEYGDWFEPLPVPVGSQHLVISASCGTVTYEDLVLPADDPAPPPPPTVPTSSPASPGSGAAEAAPASARPGSPSFTG
jgi:hypothetical protein